jgi:tRNA(Ile)-lysidine synthase
MRSHPPTLLTLVGRALREECAVERGACVVVAVSGGPDSMALLHALSRVQGDFGLSLVACGVDHGLRSEAGQELALAADFAASVGVEFIRRSVCVAPGGNLQARARTARWSELEAVRLQVGAAFIATGHHLDDRAETVLLRLLGGATPRALGVLPGRDGVRLRPLIRATRSDILAHLGRHGVPFAEDPSNRDPRFLRTRVRDELLPLLASMNPRIVEHLATLADEILAAEIPPDDIWAERAVVQVQETGADPSGKAAGQRLQLKRAHKHQLRRALGHRTGGARVLLGEGKSLVIDSRSKGTMLLDTAKAHCDQGQNNRPAGSKAFKRH